jgi:hypothetical protein
LGLGVSSAFRFFVEDGASTAALGPGTALLGPGIAPLSPRAWSSRSKAALSVRHLLRFSNMLAITLAWLASFSAAIFKLSACDRWRARPSSEVGGGLFVCFSTFSAGHNFLQATIVSRPGALRARFHHLFGARATVSAFTLLRAAEPTTLQNGSDWPLRVIRWRGIRCHNTRDRGCQSSELGYDHEIVVGIDWSTRQGDAAWSQEN